MLVRVVAPHFVAGLILDDHGFCTQAAPILNWTIGRHFSTLRPMFRSRGWTFARCPPN